MVYGILFISANQAEVRLETQKSYFANVTSDGDIDALCQTAADEVKRVMKDDLTITDEFDRTNFQALPSRSILKKRNGARGVELLIYDEILIARGEEHTLHDTGLIAVTTPVTSENTKEGVVARSKKTAENKLKDLF